MSPDLAVTHRPLETALFGVTVLACEPTAPGQVTSAVTAVSAMSPCLLVLRVDSEKAGVVQQVEAAGGRLCDVLVKLSRTLPTLTVTAGEPALNIRTGDIADIPALRRLCASAFGGFTGHWHADSRTALRAHTLYENWAESLVRNEDAQSPLWIAESAVSHEVQGFLSVRWISPGHYDVPLTAVEPSARGRGVLKRLLMFASATLSVTPGVRLDYETQLRNIAALRSVVALGFAPVSSRLTFHLWVD